MFGWRSGAGFIGAGNSFVQFGLAGFQCVHFRLHRRLVHAILDRSDTSPNLLFDLWQLVPPSILIGTTLDPQPVHLAGEFGTELLEQIGLQQVHPQPA